MNNEINLKDLKGAPLSVLIFLWMHGERVVSVAELAEATGYSDKPVKKGLTRLAELGYVSEVRKGRYQLAGDEYQLPLSWDERILSFGDSPKKTGVSPKVSGVSPDLERRIERLEAAVFRGLPAAEAEAEALFDVADPEGVQDPGTGYDGNFPQKFGISPSVSGDSPLIEVEDGSGQWTVIGDEDRYSGNFSGKFGEFPEADAEIRKGSFDGIGESPKNTGESPKNFGENPKPLIKNINNPENEKVGKYGDPDTYLPVDNNVDSELTSGGGEIPEKVRNIWNAALVQMKGSMDLLMFETLLGKADLIGYVDGHYTVRSENRQLADWADMRIRGTLESILMTMSGKGASVSFVVEPAEIQRGKEQVGQAPSGTVPGTVPEFEPGLALLPVPEDPEAAELTEICNDYLLDPTGIEYQFDELRELINLKPDPRVLRYVLQRAKRFDNAVKWCGFTFRETKEKLLVKRYKITGQALTDLMNDDRVSLEMIVEEFEQAAEEGKKPGAAYKKIMQLISVDVPEL